MGLVLMMHMSDIEKGSYEIEACILIRYHMGLVLMMHMSDVGKGSSEREAR